MTRTKVWIGAAVLIAAAIAIAGTVVGGAVCASDLALAECRTDRHATGESYDSDWHGWPVPWRTDMPEYAQRGNDWDETAIMVVGKGVSLPLLFTSLGVWAVPALTAEALLLGGWIMLRRSRRPTERKLREA